MEIKIVTEKITPEDLKRLAEESFGDMVKAVVDVERKIMAEGGELHADAERVLLENGSQQENLWGINLYPAAQGVQRIEFHSLINIRPARGNPSLDVEDEQTRSAIASIVNSLISWPE